MFCMFHIFCDLFAALCDVNCLQRNQETASDSTPMKPQTLGMLYYQISKLRVWKTLYKSVCKPKSNLLTRCERNWGEHSANEAKVSNYLLHQQLHVNLTKSKKTQRKKILKIYEKWACTAVGWHTAWKDNPALWKLHKGMWAGEHMKLGQRNAGHLNHLTPISQQCMELNLDSSKRRIMGKTRVKGEPESSLV